MTEIINLKDFLSRGGSIDPTAFLRVKMRFSFGPFHIKDLIKIPFKMIFHFSINALQPTSADCVTKFDLQHKKTNMNYEREIKESGLILCSIIKGWLLYKMLPSFLSSVIVHRGQVEVLKAASKKGLPLIILPLHRSHLDYILLSFILLDNEVKCPLVAAGDNLRIPFFGAWLRGLGAFYIRRKLDPAQGRKDIIYRTVLHSYMTECLRANHNMEFFIEGGRTRTGKPCLPKGGLLSVIIEAHLEGVIDDALLVPASLNYDRLVDGNFVREQLGQPKIPESFFSAVRAIWTVITSHYGMIRMDFGSPYSLKVCSIPLSKTKLVRALCSLLAENQDEGIGNTLSVNNPRNVTRESLMERTIELCDLLQYELVWHRPCGSIETVVEDHIDYLVEIGLLKLVSQFIIL
ncbi:hypothetical protein J437_LFUL016603 [Ladona fulva]|uniref:Phospholipid/glycerol acyltransferase domain-containing protein n=1 Tax=Ladona fulva TaxID=123851 RepID=A0A8K0KQH3_LADFU|nr:hypothetical protein J437_LFUL016603 [Ladona fulva]